jgi:hypothetical protein
MPAPAVQPNGLAMILAEPPFPDVRKLMAEILPPVAPRPPTEQLVEMAVRSAGRDAQLTNLLFLIDDPRHVERFRPLLDSKEETLRAAGCKYLGRVRDAVSFEKVARLTADPSDLVRRTAAESLGAYGRAEGVLYLFRLREDRRSAAGAADYSISAITGGLNSNDLLLMFIRVGNDNTWSFWNDSFERLFTHVRPLAVPVLIELLDPPDGYVRSPDVRKALEKATGHQIDGDEEDPTERRRLVAQWREWWKQTSKPVAAPPRVEPEATYFGYRFVIDPPTSRDNAAEQRVQYSLYGTSDMGVRVVPVNDDDEPVVQYVVMRDGTEIERGDVRPELFWGGLIGLNSRGPSATIQGPGWLTLRPRAGPGAYELQIELRALCTERVGRDFIDRHGSEGWRETAAEVITLRSNRLAFVLPAVEEETAKPRDNLKARSTTQPKSIEELMETAAMTPGADGFNWSLSRQAMEQLDGRVGPQHKQHVAALKAELAGRLNSIRDRHARRGGESLWGAYRTAFLLGCIGDKRSVGVLRLARQAGDPTGRSEGRCLCVMLRWYAAAALKLIDVQNRPAAEQSALVQAWLTHCFSSPEEHYMARSRLIPYLSQLMDAQQRRDFYDKLIPSITDPWMIHDARNFATR